MSLARRLGGCCILLSLASSPFLMYKYVAEMLPALLFNDWPFLTSFALGISVVVLSFLFFALVKEAKRSQLGRMLTGEVVPVADFFSSDKQLSVLGGPEMELLVSAVRGWKVVLEPFPTPTPGCRFQPTEAHTLKGCVFNKSTRPCGRLNSISPFRKLKALTQPTEIFCWVTVATTTAAVTCWQ